MYYINRSLLELFDPETVHCVTNGPCCGFQVVLLSATMPAEVLEVTKKFMRDPIRILVKKEELTLEGIKQFYINVEREVCFNLAQHNTAPRIKCPFSLKHPA